MYEISVSDPDAFFPFKLNAEQVSAFRQLVDFVEGKGRSVFILRGFAGTGKTSLMMGLISYLEKAEIPFELLASTGRAAKVLSDKTSRKAHTIHSLVYFFNKLDRDLEELAAVMEKMEVDKGGQLRLIFSPTVTDGEEKVVFIVDEASMIPDKETPNNSTAKFGEGRVLSDLLNYHPQGRFIFLGDPCQLPPVAQPESPALSDLYVEETLKIPCKSFDLTTVVRHGLTSGILQASLKLRDRIKNPETSKYPTFPVLNQADISVLESNEEIYHLYISNIEQKKDKETALICHTNKQRYELNQRIRKDLGRPPGELVPGDVLMVTQNNLLAPLVNGDFVRVLKVKGIFLVGRMTFQELEIEPVHQTGTKINTLIIKSLVDSQAINLNEYNTSANLDHSLS